MSTFKMGDKVIFQDKASPELKELINAVHKAEEEKYYELTHSPHYSDASLTDAEFALILRVKCRLRKQAVIESSS